MFIHLELGSTEIVMMTELNCWCSVEGDLLYLLLGFFPSQTSEEIILSDCIACESAFLAGRALLSSSLYNLAVERKGNFSAVYCDTCLSSSSQVLFEPSLLHASILFEGGWQSKEVFSAKQSPSTHFHKPSETAQAGLLVTAKGWGLCLRASAQLRCSPELMCSSSQYCKSVFGPFLLGE